MFYEMLHALVDLRTHVTGTSSSKTPAGIPDSCDAVVEYWRRCAVSAELAARSGSYGEKLIPDRVTLVPPCHRCGSRSVEDDGKNSTA